jgi:hypothetical protein
MTTKPTRAHWLTLATVLAACAPGADPEVSGGVAPIPDSPITEREQYEGSIDPNASRDHDVMPPANIDGDVRGLAPQLDGAMTIAGDDNTAVRVDALAACRPTTGYSGGRPMSICVTEVDGKLVEYRTAEAYVRMKAAASRAGVYLQIVSGWRTMEKQRELYQLYLSGRGNLAARPGYSNHQSGLALDLNTSAPGVMSWLNNNGSAYGFRRTVPSEIWHWERPAGSQGPANGGGGDGTCWSSTLSRNMPVRACVQSRSDRAWYQCTNGVWRPGQGTNGACNGTYPLGSMAPAAPTAARTCYSNTTRREQPQGACVQSASDRQWYQCTDRGWVYGASLPSRGPSGACTASFPLR